MDKSNQTATKTINPHINLSFEQIYEKYNRMVFAIYYEMLKGSDEYKDVAQNTFLQVHQCLMNFRGESALSTWIRQITVNQVLMHLRKKRRKKRQGETSLDEAKYQSINHDPAKSVDLAKLLVQLPEQCKQIIILRYIYGYSYKEMAMQSGAHPSTCNTHRFRGIKLLRNLVNDKEVA